SEFESVDETAEFKRRRENRLDRVSPSLEGRASRHQDTKTPLKSGAQPAHHQQRCNVGSQEGSGHPTESAGGRCHATAVRDDGIGGGLCDGGATGGGWDSHYG